MLAVHNLLECLDGVLELHVDPRGSSEGLSHVERLRQEPLNRELR